MQKSTLVADPLSGLPDPSDYLSISSDKIKDLSLEKWLSFLKIKKTITLSSTFLKKRKKIQTEEQ